MNLVTIYAETREKVLAAYEALGKAPNAPRRITWRLVAHFEGEGCVGDLVFTEVEEIREAYLKAGKGVFEFKEKSSKKKKADED